MVLMGFYTCRENTECFISVKKKTMVLQILAILVRVAADHLNKKNVRISVSEVGEKHLSTTGRGLE